jgi:hypothetical protein
MKRPVLENLEVLLAPNIFEITVRVLITLDVQQATQHFWTTEEHTGFSRRMDLADAFENHVPVRSAEVRWRSETSDGVLFGIGVVNHNVCCIFNADFGSEVLGQDVSNNYNERDDVFLQCVSQWHDPCPGLQWLLAMIGTIPRSRSRE